MHRATRDIYGVVAEVVTSKSGRRAGIGVLAQCFRVTSRWRAPVVRQRMLHRMRLLGGRQKWVNRDGTPLSAFKVKRSSPAACVLAG
jgi:hypothetical protein